MNITYQCVSYQCINLNSYLHIQQTQSHICIHLLWCFSPPNEFESKPELPPMPCLRNSTHFFLFFSNFVRLAFGARQVVYSGFIGALLLSVAALKTKTMSGKILKWSTGPMGTAESGRNSLWACFEWHFHITQSFTPFKYIDYCSFAFQHAAWSGDIFFFQLLLHDCLLLYHKNCVLWLCHLRSGSETFLRNSENIIQLKT